LFFYGYGQPELLPPLAVAVCGTFVFLVMALRNRAIWLPAGVVFNLLLLALFKYKFLFIGADTQGLTGIMPIDLLVKFSLPIGISFFVFQNISIPVDLTREKATAIVDRCHPVHRVLSTARFGPDSASRNVFSADQAEICCGCTVPPREGTRHFFAGAI